MTDRVLLQQAFIAQTDWADAIIAPLAGDASNRRYLRLTRAATGETAVLMDAPPEKGEDVRPFLHIARYLTGLGLSAPRILAEDTENGFLILEDLGDALFARVIPKDANLELPLYTAATDLLAELHRHAPPPNLAAYSPGVMADMAALAFDWYLLGATGDIGAQRGTFHAAIKTSLSTHASETNVLIQRDYHAENLLWLGDRAGVARVGLLDFQDAMLGHPAYDLVSILQDARRDVPPAIEQAMIARYIDKSGADPETFETAYRCLGAQRNLRILGVFARLCMRDGKAHYVDLIPRVWAHLGHDLSHPAMAPVAEIARAVLPPPTPTILQRLKDLCASKPTR
ncbi:Phosphotransferase enzyme family protein [Roseovarius gaetbuli]|uniref:Phosphotransferase enzyme family protein n=1 Tax=Roseovarius gaetbuli TaxID=1356575 RepID=A0A1X6YWR9_9RHOB|nr:phosphotransferase [Roseovarius gaetbuli]SLN33050.1 Phosphotransferase enzyme family protein [Roseovarius gaetbuli]